MDDETPYNNFEKIPKKKKVSNRDYFKTVATTPKKFSPSYTNKQVSEWQDAMYQYLGDHVTWFNKTPIVRFVLVDKDELVRRIRARKEGRFMRKDLRDLKKEAEEAVQTAKWQKRADLSRVYAAQNGTFLERLTIRLYFFLKNKIVKKIEDKYWKVDTEKLEEATRERCRSTSNRHSHPPTTILTRLVRLLSPLPQQAPVPNQTVSEK